MKTIELGYNYRLRKRDKRNWELERCCPPRAVKNPKTESVEKWRSCGKYYQSVGAGARAAFEMILRDGDEECTLDEAIARMEEVAATLKRNVENAD